MTDAPFPFVSQGHGFKSCRRPEFLSGFLCNCINCVHNSEGHSSFDFISAVFIYDLFDIHLSHSPLSREHFEHIIDQVPTSVASWLSWLEQFALVSPGHRFKSRWSPEQALRSALAAGQGKEGELATMSLEFEFHLQFPCGSLWTELSDFCQSAQIGKHKGAQM